MRIPFEKQCFEGDEGEIRGIDGVQTHQRNGEEQPSLQPDERGEVAETLRDREVDERYDVEYDEQQYHWIEMLRWSRKAVK